MAVSIYVGPPPPRDQRGPRPVQQRLTWLKQMIPTTDLEEIERVLIDRFELHDVR